MEYRKHLGGLRDTYARLNPGQRYHIAMQRVNVPNCRPNQLIHLLSAIEGFARAIAIDNGRKEGRTPKSTYREVRNLGPDQIIEKHICPPLKKKPAELFSAGVWSLFHWAIKYRNLFVHECTFLRQELLIPLIAASRAVLKTLKEIAGVKDI